jgi:hypothetical protein
MAPAVTALAPAVDAVVGVPVTELFAVDLQERIAAVDRQVQRLSGWVSAATGELHSMTAGQVRVEGSESLRSVVGWLAEATSTSSGAAGSRVRTATALRSLPLVVDAVLDGVLSQEQAAVLARLVGRVPQEGLAECEVQLVQVAAGRDPVQLAQWVRHLIATHCEPELEAQEAAGRERRFLQTRTEADGTVRGRFVLAGGDGEAVLAVLESLSRRQGDTDERSAGQRRADALVEMADQVLRHGDLPDHGGARPQLSYVLPAEWAARQADRAACPTCSSCALHRPASLADTVAAALPGGAGVPAEQACATAAWTGPQTRPRLEALLCDARISRVLLDGAGQVRGLETLSDCVTPSQRRALAARDLGCAARGCTRPPAACDAHHLVGLAQGGPTTLSNLVLLCRRHHVLWHLGKIALVDLHVPWHPDATGSDPPRE